MKTQHFCANVCINWRMLALLSILLLLAYSNTFNASWHFDDFHNITQNPKIQINNLYPKTLYNVLFEDSGNNRVFNRPVSNLSFALNWYFGQDDVVGYHIVNILVHILTAFFLYLSVLALLNTPNLVGKYPGSEYFIAILAAVLWAVNPIQTQAVTYIVQRMASMAALFYIIGIYLYIKARIDASWKKRALLYIGTFIMFLLAVCSKENALMFPVSLFIVEIVFFQDTGNPIIRKRFIWIGCLLAAALFAMGVILFMSNGFIERLQDGYENRTFSLTERLLTQPRILVFYISQIFYPIADRLSIVHDFEVSSGLFRPWTTFPAVLFILGLIGVAFWKIKRYPLVSFAILFFFANHVIESSIIPLELVFEHRNYLPSFFLFAPIAAGIKWAIDYYKKENRSMAAVISAFVTILVMVLGIGTYVRNMAWASDRSLWQDALEKAPGSARPYQNQASAYYAKVGDYDKVESLCEQAIDLYDSTRHKAMVLSLENIANAYAKRDKDYEKVIEIYKQVLTIDSKRFGSRYHLTLALIQTDELDRASDHADKLLSKESGSVEYLNIKAFILLKKRQAEKALPYLIKAIKRNPGDVKANLSLGRTKMLMGKYEAAKHYLDRIPVRSPQKTIAGILLIENSVRAGDHSKAKKYAEKLIVRASPQKIRKTIQKANEPGLTLPISAELVLPVIADVIQKESINMSGLLKTTTDEG